MRDDVRHQPADECRAHDDEERRPRRERYGCHEMPVETRLIQGGAEREAAGDEPQHAPVDVLKVVFREDACNAVYRDRDHRHDIGVEPGKLVEHPQQDGDSHSDVSDREPPAFLRLAFDVKFDGFLLEREEKEQQAPCDEEQHDGVREHHEEPVAEADAHVEAFGVVEELECYGVGRRADRRGDAADVGPDRDGHDEAEPALAVNGQLTQHGRHERQHHGGRGRVADEHREQACHEEETEEHELRAASEEPQEGFRELHVNTHLRGDGRDDEAAEEQHDGRVGEGRHDILVLYQRADPADAVALLQETDGAGGTCQKQQHDDEHRRRPRRDGLRHPHRESESEDGDDTLLDD